ncbi:MAG: rRNA maturation RNase YbeY [Ignavibacteria bacterium GWF2_33_9]|nr:MAG: rRNA maturation RNase YbeY [Ignavibacteria bacterium GWF2_33_9]
MNQINIFNETNFKPVPRKKIQYIANKIFVDNNFSNASINIIILNNEDLKKINKEFLNHNYYTDVISFRLEDDPLESEVYISIEKAEENARGYKVSLTNELLRLVAHGTLHIVGFDDDTKEKRDEMHKLENFYINSRNY